MQLNIEKGASPPLHQGLMLTLYKYALALNPHGNPLAGRNENLDHFEEDIEEQPVDENSTAIEILAKEPNPCSPPIVAARRVLIPTKI